MTALWKLRSIIAGMVGAHMPTALKANSGATVILKASHRSAAGNVHAHEWEITAICPEHYDAMILQYNLRNWLSPYEGNCLPDRLARGEQLAMAICIELGCSRVEVRRHAEGIYAEFVA
jgi:hypothetical protein